MTRPSQTGAPGGDPFARQLSLLLAIAAIGVFALLKLRVERSEQ